MDVKAAKKAIIEDGEGVVDEAKSQLKAIVLTREHKAIFPQERSRIQKETSSASLAVRRLVKEAVRERRCKDNCTAVLIIFKH
nr:unnamed protein product [Digitaria exilis]